MVIRIIIKEGDRVEGVFDVREAVFKHIKHHFFVLFYSQIGVDNLQFRKLSHVEGATLTMLFCLDEVKAAVWNC